jgi:hypothetical protein
MKLSLFRPMKGVATARVRLILAGAVAALALSAVTASSASAFSWWVGTPTPHELVGKLPINNAATVHQPFTLKWLGDYEVKCTALSYNNMFLEGPVFLGAQSIIFEKCKAKKPKHTVLVGETIETTQLGGEIRPNGASVEFEFTPVSGTLTTFTLERTIKRKHKRPSRQCKLEVSAIGGLGGTLGDATVISNEKTYEFDSQHLMLKQHRSCVTAPAARPAGTPKEEVERIKKELEECKAGIPPGKTPAECARVEKEAKKLGKKEHEAGEEEAEETKEEEEGLTEEHGGTVEENKGNSSYSATEGWGVE